MPVEMQKLKVHRDQRGMVFEPLEGRRLVDQGNVHVVVSRPGAVRGNHVHRRGTETVTVVGQALVRYRKDGVDRDVDIPEGEAYRFVFPPGVAHAILNNGDGPSLLVAFGSLAHDPLNPDTETEVLIDAGRI